MSAEVTIVDYGCGNLFSVARAIAYAGGVPRLGSRAADIERAERLLLPGVGAFAEGMQGLHERGLIEPIRQYGQSDHPLLGICLGMQMLATYSQEFGEHPGLNLIPGGVVPVPVQRMDGQSHKVPHIGWAELLPTRPNGWSGTLLDSVSPGVSVYMVHSYHVVPDAAEHLLASCEYGVHQLTAAIQAGRVMGCQFHPEKSGPAGIDILRTFLQL